MHDIRNIFLVIFLVKKKWEDIKQLMDTENIGGSYTENIKREFKPNVTPKNRKAQV